VRETVYSAAAAGIFDRRSSSRSASFLDASGMPRLDLLGELFDLLGLIVAFAELLLIAFICSRRKYSRWFLPTSDWTCDWIFEPSSSTRAP
jgi:hypothetical protein